MSKRALLRLATSVYLMVSVIFLGQISTFADEIEPTWTTLSSMSTSRERFQTEVINGKIYIIGGRGTKGTLSSTEACDPATDKWTEITSLSKSRDEFQTEVLNGKIYAIGGRGGTESTLSSTEVYDPATDKWTTLSSMSTSRACFQTEVINGKIYVIGGTGTKGTLSSTEVYDPATNTWATLASMSTSRDEFQTEVIDGKIYAIGGFDSSFKPLSSVEVYDPIADTWTKITSMSTSRRYLQTEVINEKIYAIGGWDTGALSSTEVYDPATDKWTTLSPMSTSRQRFQTEVINEKIYAIGGDGTNGAISSAEVYDPAANKWTTLAAMSTPRSMLRAEEINGKIYAIGGNNLSSMEVYTVTPNSDTSSNLKATGGDAKVDLTWNAVTDATSYTIKRSTTAGGPYTTIATNVTATTYTDIGVTYGTTYYYVVTAIVNGSEGWNSNEASATPQASIDQPTGNKALLVITMVTGERKEYEMTTDKINDFVAWYNSKAASSPTYVIEKDYNKASFTSRKDYIAYEQISNFEVNEYNN